MQSKRGEGEYLAFEAAHEKTSGNVGLPEAFKSDADETRTRNHRIDSPVL